MFLTRSQVAESILMKLGHPIHDINLKLLPDSISPRNHLDDTINQTLDFFFAVNVNESTYMTYIMIPTIPGESVYKVPYWIEEVIEVYSSFNGMLANPFMMLDVGNMEAFVSMNLNFADWNLANYTAAKMDLAEIQKSVGPMYSSKLVFNEEGEKELHIMPCPPKNESSFSNKFLVGKVYRRAPLGQIFGHRYFVEIAAARLMEMWGLVLNLYDAPLPGGGKINGQFIYDQGVSRREKYEQMLRDESAQPIIGVY